MNRRADFIWLPDQKIKHDAYFGILHGEPLRRDDGLNRWVQFRKVFHLPERPSLAKMKITCDGRYVLYANGSRIGRGPARSAPHRLRLDSLDVGGALKEGANIIAALVHTPGIDLAWYETAKGGWQPVFGDGGLYVELDILCGEKSIEIISGADWRCIETDAWRRNTPRSGWGQDFIEDFSADRIDPQWIHEDFDDGHWPNAQAMRSSGDAGAVATGRGAHVPFPTLVPSKLPPLSESIEHPDRVVWTHGVRPRPDLPLDRQIYDEQLCKAPDNMFETPEALIADDDCTAIIKTSKDLDAGLLLSFSPVITGYPFIEIEAEGGEIIDVAAAEGLPGEFSPSPPETIGLKRNSQLAGAHLFRYRARAGKQWFEKFEWTSVRALQLHIRNAPHGLKIRCVGVRKTNYPAQCLGAFDSDDPILNKLWRIGRHTALQCMHDSFEDCPGREKRQWVGDGVVHLNIADAAFGPSAHPLGAQFLQNAAESQRGDGLLQMFAPGDHHEHGVVIPDFTLHWICGVRNYWMSTADTAFAEKMFPVIEKALQWFSCHVDRDLISNMPYWHFIEWAHVGRCGRSAPVNALYAGALEAASELAEAIDFAGASRRYSNQHEEVKEALLREHWNPHRGVFVDEVDPDTGRQCERVSQHANALMIAFDLAPRECWDDIIRVISDESSLKFTAAPPIFNEAPAFHEDTDIVRTNTFFCHFLYDAYGKAGRFDLALAHMRTFYTPMLETGTTTLWESFASSASLCHVFSASPVYHLSRRILGIECAAPGFTAATIRPQFCNLNRVSGRYPTRVGNIELSWERKDNSAFIDIRAPREIKITFTSPDGYSIADQRRVVKDSLQILHTELR